VRRQPEEQEAQPGPAAGTGRHDLIAVGRVDAADRDARTQHPRPERDREPTLDESDEADHLLGFAVAVDGGLPCPGIEMLPRTETTA
jgi:hypothetical protein